MTHASASKVELNRAFFHRALERGQANIAFKNLFDSVVGSAGEKSDLTKLLRRIFAQLQQDLSVLTDESELAHLFPYSETRRARMLTLGEDRLSWRDQNLATDAPDSGPSRPVDVTPVRRRGPGRPPWPRSEIRERLNEAVAATPPPLKPERIAEHFRRRDGVMGVSPRWLARLKRRMPE
jgi:hypothetical protein